MIFTKYAIVGDKIAMTLNSIIKLSPIIVKKRYSALGINDSSMKNNKQPTANNPVLTKGTEIEETITDNGWLFLIHFAIRPLNKPAKPVLSRHNKTVTKGL